MIVFYRFKELYDTCHTVKHAPDETPSQEYIYIYITERQNHFQSFARSHRRSPVIMAQAEHHFNAFTTRDPDHTPTTVARELILPLSNVNDFVLTMLSEAFATSIGVGLPVAAWKELHNAFAPEGSNAGGDIGAAALFALTQPAMEKAIRLLMAKLYGVLSPCPETNAFKIIADKAITALIGAATVGGALGVVDQLTKAHPSAKTEIAAFLIGFFLFSCVSTIISVAVLRTQYVRTKCPIPWTDYLATALNAAFTELIALRTLLSDRLGKLISFAIYPQIGLKWIRFWLKNGPGIKYVGWATVLNLLWFFAEYAVCLTTAAAVAAAILPTEEEAS